MKYKKYFLKPDIIKILVIGIVLISFFFVHHRFQPASVISPNGGEIFGANNPWEISWTPGNPGIRQIDLVPATGDNPIIIYRTADTGYPVPDTSGQYLFTPSPGTISPGSYYIKIYYTNSTSYDLSDKPFRVVTDTEEYLRQQVPPKPAITLISPNGGEVYKAGSALKVVWKSENIPSSTSINVELLSIDNTTYPNEAVTAYYVSAYSANSGKKSIDIPPYLKTGSYYIQVSCRDLNIKCEDKSDKAFGISAAATPSTGQPSTTPIPSQKYFSPQAEKVETPYTAEQSKTVQKMEKKKYFWRTFFNLFR